MSHLVGCIDQIYVRIALQCPIGLDLCAGGAYVQNGAIDRVVSILIRDHCVQQHTRSLHASPFNGL